jgi:peptidoglycan DL-endopeptidase CwlO
MKGWRRLTNKWWTGLLLLGLCSTPSRAEEPSLGEKIKQIFTTPTPTPSHRRHKHTSKKSSPSPSPSATPRRKHKARPTPTPEETPGAKRKKILSSPSPSPTPTETPTPSPEESPSPSPSPTPRQRVATVAPNQIEGFEENPEPVRKLLRDALDLTKRNLDYKYGSADPAEGGMDCSGFIYFVLRENGVKDVPRDSSGQYVWVRKVGNFRAVLSRDLDSFELDELKPGDLLFWAGTYDIERDPPVTHTMIYLGKEKESDKPIMVGASDGRTYEGEQQFGVSVFDFKTASAKNSAGSGNHPRFVGYARIPGLDVGKENAKP